MLPLALTFNAPTVEAKPFKLAPLLWVTVNEPVVPDNASVAPGVKDVFVMLFAAVLLKEIALVFVVNGPTAPLPPFNASVSPDMVPAVWLMVPALVAVKVTDVGPVMLPDTVIEPFPAEVEATEIVLPAVSAPVVMFWSLLKFNEPTVPETLSMLPENVVFVIVVAPESLRTMLLAFVVKAPTAPVPALMFNVSPRKVPAV
jgi:hypothetical protein